MESKTKVYNNSLIQNKERYLKAFTNKEIGKINAYARINLDEFKQIVIKNEFINITELLEEFDEVYIIPHDAENENFVDNENIQHYHIYIKTKEHNNTIYKKINSIKRINKQTFIKQLHNLNIVKIKFTNEKKLKEERILKMKKTLLHYNTITTFLNEIPKFSGAVIVKENGEEVALGDRKSGFSKKELENLKNNTSQRVPLYIQYILTLADNLTTEERKEFEEKLKKEFGDKVIINNNNPKQIVFTVQNFEIENDILKIHKITNTHLQVLKFLNENDIGVINMDYKNKWQVFKHIKYKEDDIKDMNKYIIKPVLRTYEDYLQTEEQTQQKQEVKETTEQKTEQTEKQTEKEEIDITEIKDEEIKTELENINNEIETIKNIKYIDENTKKQILKDLQTKKTELYNRYLEKLEEEKKQQIEQLKKNLQNKEEEILKIKEQLESLRTENEELRTERNELNDKLESIQNDINKIKEILELEEDADLDTVIKTLNNKLEEYNKTVKELNAQIKTLNDKITTLERKNAELIRENATLKEEKGKLEESIKTVKKERDERSEVIKKQEKEIDSLNKKLEEKDKQIEELQNIIKDFNINYISKEEHKKILKEEKEKFKKQLEKQAKEHIKQHYVKKDVITDLNNKIKKLEDKNKEIKKFVLDFLETVDLSEEEKQEIISRFRDLDM